MITHSLATMLLRFFGAAGIALLLFVATAVPAGAYEYQNGNSVNCSAAYEGASVWMQGKGDSNLYSSYRLERYAYNVAYSTSVYLSKNISENSSASAADSENYVEFVGASCWPYD